MADLKTDPRLIADMLDIAFERQLHYTREFLSFIRHTAQERPPENGTRCIQHFGIFNRTLTDQTCYEKIHLKRRPYRPDRSGRCWLGGRYSFGSVIDQRGYRNKIEE